MAGEQTEQPIDDFEAAFAQISEADAKGETVKAGDIKAAPVVEKTAEQVEAERVETEAAAATAAAEKTAADAEAATAAANAGKTPEQIAAEATAAEEAAKAAAAATAAEEAARRADVRDEHLASTVARAIKTTEAEATAAAAAAKAAAAPPPPLLTEEQLVKVQAFEKEFPEIATAQAIIRQAEYKQLTGHIFSEVGRYFEGKFAPVATLLQNLAERTHLGDLKTMVPDYDKLDVKTLATWVSKQPAYLQSAYDTVMKSGTGEEVQDLIARFRKDTGTAPAAQVAKSPAEVAAAATAEAARKKVVASLAPVASARSGVAAAAPPSDYDGAFEAAARELQAAEGTDRFTR